MLLKNLARLYFVYRYCYKHKYIDTSCRGIFKTTRLPLATARYLEERRRSYSYKAPSKALVTV
jgi:hypothetical protein